NRETGGVASALDSVTCTPLDHFRCTTSSISAAIIERALYCWWPNSICFPSEDFQAVVGAQLMNQTGTTYNLPVENVPKCRATIGDPEVVVRLYDQVTDVGELNITLTLRGMSTNSSV